MPWSYEKLWIRIANIGINKSKLRDDAGFRPSTLSRLSHNQPVNMETLARICRLLDCNVGDIVDYVHEEDNHEKNVGNQ